jgi:hypothetical protein
VVGDWQDEGGVIIFGFGGSKLTDRGAVWPATCANCHNQVLLHHITTHATFRLFFVPILPYDRVHFLLCPICQKGMRLKSVAVPQVEAAKQLLVKARLGEITQQQYEEELARLRNAPLPPAEEIEGWSSQ